MICTYSADEGPPPLHRLGPQVGHDLGMTLLTINGIGERHLVAERASLTARISIGSRNREESIQKAAAVHNQLVAEAQSLRASGAATWHQADPSTTWVRQWVDNSNVTRTEHVTSSVVRVKLAALNLVPEVVERWSTLGANVQTDWALTEATKATHIRQLRSHAVADARAKANDFAKALDQQVVGVAALRETQDYAGPTVRGASAAAGAPEVTIAEITLTVSITVNFETN